MATQRSGFAVPLLDFAASLLQRRELPDRAQLIAEQVLQIEPDCDVVVYTLEASDDSAWTPKAVLGEITVGSESIPLRAGSLGALAAAGSPLVLLGTELAREDYAHLDVRRTIASLAYVPLVSDGAMLGAIEMVTYDQPAGSELLQAVHAIAQLASPAIAGAMAYESERNNSLQSITRVTQMYDLEKVFNSNLELDDLLATIASKVHEVMNVQGVNLWMVAGDRVVLTNQAGLDVTVSVDMSQGPEEGVAGKVSDDGKPVRIDNTEDERLQARNAGRKEGAILSLLAAPLMDRESLVGVVELVNRLDGKPFDEDDEFVLANVCDTASNALHNANLLLAERKVEILEALVKVSGEITSTLDLDRVLDAVVNGPARVIPYERAAIALEQRGGLQVRAVSGMTRINPQDPTVVHLQDLLEWASACPAAVFITQRGDEIDDEREETRAKFRKYFAESGMRAFYAVRLVDDDGELGMLSLESSDPDFLTVAHQEMVKILAAQATVALRNASLYREVPFISIIEPVLKKKRQFLALEGRRRAALVGAAAGVVLLAAALPMPLRVAGDASIAPVHTAHVQPEVEGVVARVNVREGSAVKPGDVLASVADWQYRADLAAAQAKYETAVSEMNRALAANDGATAGRQRIQADYWKAEVERARERLEQTQLRTPIAGVVATAHVEDSVGRQLKPGDTFADVVDTSQADVDIAVDEGDVSLVRAGQPTALKLEGFPSRTFHGRVTVVSPKSELSGDEHVFFARAEVPNPDGAIRAGMQGRSKISTGWSPAGRVIFRRPAMWLWQRIWSWFGW